MKTEDERIDELIQSIKIVKPNLSNIAKLGFISGILYTEIKRIIKEFSEQTQIEIHEK